VNAFNDSIRRPDENVAAAFETTHWSVVLAAGRGPSADADRAFADLCSIYWYPVYSYVRRRLADAEAALDGTQEFFLRLLERNTVAVASPGRGRFRTFLLTSCQNFLTNEWKREQALKRGGGRLALSLDVVMAESRFAAEPFCRDAPERAFDRVWAVTLLERVLERLAEEFRRDGKEDVFSALKSTLTATGAEESYVALAAKLGTTPGAIKVSVHRLRRRYRELLRAEIASTIDTSADIEEEMRALFEILSS
jgi:RNA polymerase sigma factor (sigma-70 family)